MDHPPPHDRREQSEHEDEDQSRQRSSRGAGTNRLHDVDSKGFYGGHTSRGRAGSGLGVGVGERNSRQLRERAGVPCTPRRPERCSFAGPTSWTAVARPKSCPPNPRFGAQNTAVMRCIAADVDQPVRLRDECDEN
jgi:hypothetical protein